MFVMPGFHAVPTLLFYGPHYIVLYGKSEDRCIAVSILTFIHDYISFHYCIYLPSILSKSLIIYKYETNCNQCPQTIQILFCLIKCVGQHQSIQPCLAFYKLSFCVLKCNFLGGLWRLSLKFI